MIVDTGEVINTLNGDFKVLSVVATSAAYRVNAQGQSTLVADVDAMKSVSDGQGNLIVGSGELVKDNAICGAADRDAICVEDGGGNDISVCVQADKRSPTS